MSKKPDPQTSIDYFGRMLYLSDTIYDLEKARIAMRNRLESITEAHDPSLMVLGEVQTIDSIGANLEANEKLARKELDAILAASPLGEWVQTRVGLGPATAGRLLGVIGNPMEWIDDEGNVHPRTIGSLWHYCGLAPGHDRKVKGQQLTFNPYARTRLYVAADVCMKNKKSAFRPFYDEGREKYANAIHIEPCVRCGPKGKPAAIGSGLSDGHKHGRAMRIVMKEILRDLWEFTDGLPALVPA